MTSLNDPFQGAANEQIASGTVTFGYNAMSSTHHQSHNLLNLFIGRRSAITLPKHELFTEEGVHS